MSCQLWFEWKKPATICYKDRPRKTPASEQRYHLQKPEEELWTNRRRDTMKFLVSLFDFVHEEMNVSVKS